MSLPNTVSRIYCTTCEYLCRYRTDADGKHYCVVCGHCCSDEFHPVEYLEPRRRGSSR